MGNSTQNTSYRALAEFFGAVHKTGSLFRRSLSFGRNRVDESLDSVTVIGRRCRRSAAYVSRRQIDLRNISGR
jgi:hypothetical protein